MKRKLTQEEKAIKYIWEQIERWLYYRYGVRFQVTVQPSYLQQFGLFSRVEFRGQQCTVYVDKKLLRDGKKDDWLAVAGRCAIEVYFTITNRVFSDTNEETVKELEKYGLPVYGTIKQTGSKLRVYSCAKCNQWVLVSVRKVPSSKEFEYNPKNLTKCCNAVIKDDGWREFTNQESQEILKRFGNS